MGISSRLPTSWKSMRADKGFSSPRVSVVRGLAIIAVSGIFAYLLWFPLHYLLQTAGGGLSMKSQVVIPRPGEDALKHFAGSRDCAITQDDIYHVPWPVNPNVSPFCKNKATLLEALSSGGRHGLDAPYVGRGCTYRWFSIPEICMILERFNVVLFVGDSFAKSVYTAFNMLIQEDLSMGGLQHWNLGDQDRLACKCESQLLNGDCLGYAIKNSEESMKNVGNDHTARDMFCQRVKHSYIQVHNTPASSESTTLFKSLTYGKPKPWQPSPIIYSFSQGANYNAATAAKAADEWSALATKAERNIPVLMLGAPAVGLNRPPTASPRDGNSAVWKFNNDISEIAKQKHFDVLGLYNLTLQAFSGDEGKFGLKVALVEAMMAINWLSKLETS